MNRFGPRPQLRLRICCQTHRCERHQRLGHHKHVSANVSSRRRNNRPSQPRRCGRGTCRRRRRGRAPHTRNAHTAQSPSTLCRNGMRQRLVELVALKRHEEHVPQPRGMRAHGERRCRALQRRVLPQLAWRSHCRGATYDGPNEHRRSSRPSSVRNGEPHHHFPAWPCRETHRLEAKMPGASSRPPPRSIVCAGF